MTCGVERSCEGVGDWTKPWSLTSTPREGLAVWGEASCALSALRSVSGDSVAQRSQHVQEPIHCGSVKAFSRIGFVWLLNLDNKLFGFQ